MELNEAVRRIVWQHRLLILFFVAAGVGLATLLHTTDVKTYTASSRLVLDTADPESRAESAAIADMAKAIATSPSQVNKALDEAGVTGRDDEVVVSVRALGSSGVLQLSVTDRDARAAAAISNALASALIETRLAVTGGQVKQVIAEIDGQIAEVNMRISRVDGDIDALSIQAATADTLERANSARAKRNEAARLRDFLAQQRSVLESQRAHLLATDALRPKPSIINVATPPGRPDPSRRLADLVLGGLLGLVLGVGLAALAETFRPRLVGGNALAREFDTPLLGTLGSNPDEDRALQESAQIAGRLRLAAEGEHVRSVSLLALGPPVDLGPLAETLDGLLGPLAEVLDVLLGDPHHDLAGTLEGSGTGPARSAQALLPRARFLVPAYGRVYATRESKGFSAPLGESRPHLEAPPTNVANGPRHEFRVRPFGLDNGSLTSGEGTGLVLVAPTTLKRTELVAASHLLRVTRLPLLGLITYKPSPLRRRHRARHRADETPAGT